MATIKKTVEIDLWNDLLSDERTYKDIMAVMLDKEDDDIQVSAFSCLIEAVIDVCGNAKSLDQTDEWLIEQMCLYRDCKTPFDSTDKDE